MLKTIWNWRVVKKDFRMTSSTYRNNVNVDIMDNTNNMQTINNLSEYNWKNVRSASLPSLHIVTILYQHTQSRHDRSRVTWLHDVSCRQPVMLWRVGSTHSATIYEQLLAPGRVVSSTRHVVTCRVVNTLSHNLRATWLAELQHVTEFHVLNPTSTTVNVEHWIESLDLQNVHWKHKTVI